MSVTAASFVSWLLSQPIPPHLTPRGCAIYRHLVGCLRMDYWDVTASAAATIAPRLEENANWARSLEPGDKRDALEALLVQTELGLATLAAHASLASAASEEVAS